MTKVVNIKSKEPYHIYCGRQNMFYGLKESLFHNPFIIGKDGNREEVLIKFKNYLYKRISEDDNFNHELWKLKDKTLACWCKPEKCHCDIIAELLDGNFCRCIIAGSRTIYNYKAVEHIINQTIKQHNLIINEVVCGEAKGVDTCGKQYGINNKIQIKSFPAEWDKFGKSAGYIRNEEMAKYATHLILIWDGLSKGSKHMLDLANKYNLKIYEWVFQ